MKAIRDILDKVLVAFCCIIFVLMIIVGSYQIISRYFFNSPSTISEELLTYSFTWLALFSAAYVFGKRDHMRMGFLADKLPKDTKKILDIIIEIGIIVFAAVVLLYGGIRIMSLTMTQVTASLGIPMGIVYTAVPLSGVMIVLYGILNIFDLATGNIIEKVEE